MVITYYRRSIIVHDKWLFIIIYPGIIYPVLSISRLIQGSGWDSCQVQQLQKHGSSMDF